MRMKCAFSRVSRNGTPRPMRVSHNTTAGESPAGTDSNAPTNAALTDAAAAAADAEVKPAKKARVKTSAMIASIADPGQRTAPAPLGHALVDAFDSVPPGDKPAVVICDTRIGRGVPFLEPREKAHFIRIDEHEWDLARQALRAANPAGSN